MRFPPDKVASPLEQRPYDLRHSCITNWLNAGVPVAEVARRAGNSPEVIHRRYDGYIDGHEELNNRGIEQAMGWEESTRWPGAARRASMPTCMPT
jgi:hypothetical protein